MIHINIYDQSFKVYRYDNINMAKAHVSGLMRCEKNHTKMERMSKKVSKNDYNRYHHFLSESEWDWSEVNRITAINAFEVMHEQKRFTSGRIGLNS